MLGYPPIYGNTHMCIFLMYTPIYQRLANQSARLSEEIHLFHSYSKNKQIILGKAACKTERLDPSDPARANVWRILYCRFILGTIIKCWIFKQAMSE